MSAPVSRVWFDTKPGAATEPGCFRIVAPCGRNITGMFKALRMTISIDCKRTFAQCRLTFLHEGWDVLCHDNVVDNTQLIHGSSQFRPEINTLWIDHPPNGLRQLTATFDCEWDATLPDEYLEHE